MSRGADFDIGAARIERRYLHEYGLHALEVHHAGQLVGALDLHEHGEVSNIHVHEDYRRRGVATALWQHAQHLADRGVLPTAPMHSSDRTPAGTAWATRVGGHLPRLGGFG